jgi:magnesium transporter
MDVHWVSAGGCERHRAADLASLLGRADGFVWVDLPSGDERATPVLREVFGFHPLAIRDSVERSLVPMVHPYADHLLLILHAPEPGAAGRIRHVELDQFVGCRYLVTVHEPPGDGVGADGTLRAVRAVRDRIEAGKYSPGSPAELAYAVVSTLIRRTEAFVAALAERVAALERGVLGGDRRLPEQGLEAMFLLRQELRAVRAMAAQNREVSARAATLAARFLPPADLSFVEELAARFDRTRSLCDAEHERLQGVIDFSQARATAKINLATERLALLAAVVLPITALASIYGMNVIVHERTQPLELGAVLALMVLVTAVLLWWAKRQGWW